MRTDEIQDVQVFVVMVFHPINFQIKILIRIDSYNLMQLLRQFKFLMI